MPLKPREKRVVAGGAAAATLLLLFLLWPGEPNGGAVELVPSDQRAAPAPQASPAAPPVAVAPAPSPVAATPEGLALHGVMASGAVIGFADGSQRYVAVGRDVMPGLRLEAVQLHHAILAAGTTNYRLGFGGAASAIAPAGQPAAPTAAPASNAAETRRMAAERAETTRFRQALAPRQSGQGSGYTLRPGFSLPVLAQAGLQPGDTILDVNGSRLGPEQLEELAWTITNSDRTELQIERGGRRMRVSISPPR